MLSSLALPAVGGGYFEPRQCQNSVVLVYFFSSWCFTCLADLPFINRLSKETSGTCVLGVGLDLDGAKTLAPLSQQFELTFPVLLADSDLLNGQSPFGPIRGVPTTVVFDREGQLDLAFHGPMDHQNFERYLQKLVKP